MVGWAGSFQFWESYSGPDSMVRQAGCRIQVQCLESRPGNQEACRLGKEGAKGQERRGWKKGALVTGKGYPLDQGCLCWGFPWTAPGSDEGPASSVSSKEPS